MKVPVSEICVKRIWVNQGLGVLECSIWDLSLNQGHGQRYTYRVLQTIQMNLMLLWVWAEWAVLGRAKTALKFKFEI